MKNNKLIFMVAGLLLSGCQKRENDGCSDSRPVIDVETMVISNSYGTSSQSYSGTIEEDTMSPLSFSLSGTIKTVHIGLGDHVKKGELLATLDDQSIQSSYNSANATLKQAQDAYNRMKLLYDNGSLPEIKWVEVQTRLDQAVAAEEMARKNLNDTKLYAPFNGVISEKSMEIGQNVIPGMSVAKIVTPNSTKIKISVPESEINLISLNRNATVAIPALDNATFEAYVIEKGVVANPMSRTYEVKLRLKDASVNAMPGMVTHVTIASMTDNDVSGYYTLPADVVMLDESNNYFVWLITNGKAKKQIVKCTDFTSTGIIVSSGISSGDKIIINGQHKVSEGTSVNIKK